jgi:hypothetical protein
MLNAQCSILIRKALEHVELMSYRMKIEHWELSIGQILSPLNSPRICRHSASSWFR